MKPFRATREKVDNAVTSVNDSAQTFGATMKKAADTLGLVGVVAVAALILSVAALIITAVGMVMK